MEKKHYDVPKIHCFKCKKKTDNVDISTVQAANGSWRTSAKCKVCGARKSKFLKRGWKIVQDGMTNHHRQIEAAEVNKPIIKKFQKRKIMTLGIDDLWAVDLLVMISYRDDNDGYGYMLNVLDTFSKYAWSEPLKTKDGLTVAKAFQNIITRGPILKHDRR